MALREVEGDDGREYLGDFLAVSGRVEQRFVVEDGGVGSLDVFGGVEQLLQTRHTQRDVLVGHTGQMEGVEGHLRGGFADGLRCHRSDGLTGRRK